MHKFQFYRIWGILLLVVTGVIAGHSSEKINYKVTSYTLEEGLPQSQVLTILQDRDGYLWMGTNGGGAVRYDGYEFQAFTTSDGLSSNAVRTIVEDSAGNIWMLAGNGLSRFDGRRFHAFPADDSVDFGAIHHICRGKGNEVWISAEHGLFRYHHDTLVRFGPHNTQLPIKDIGRLDYRKGEGLWGIARDTGIFHYQYETGEFRVITSEDGLPSHHVSNIFVDRQGGVWLRIRDYPALICYRNDTFYEINLQDGLRGTGFMEMHEGKNGNMWLAHWKGVVKFPMSKLKFYSTDSNNFASIHTYFTDTNGLVSKHCYAVFQDREGNIWVGNRGGLNKFQVTPFRAFTKKDGLPHNSVYGIRTWEDEVWLATGNGIARFKEGQIRHHQKHAHLRGGKFQEIGKDRQGRLWFASNVGRVHIYDGSSFHRFPHHQEIKIASIWEVYQSENGDMWFGGYGRGLFRYTGDTIIGYTREQGVCDNVIRTVWEGSDGDIWMGTNEGCVSRLRTGGRNSSKAQVQSYGRREGLPGGRVLASVKDQRGNVWLGTFGGLVHYNGREFIHYNQDSGLTTSTIYFLQIDSSRHLWMGTNKGLDRLDLQKYYAQDQFSIKHYGKREGFSGLECNPGAVTLDADNNVWFGTIHGAIRYISRHDQPNQVETKTNITRFRVHAEDTFLRDHSVLPYYQDQITFNFVGICLTNPEKVRYQYQLEGLNDDWQPVTKEQVAHYTNLSPGEYTFKVRSRNNEGVWNQAPTTFHFTISPPFWQTTEFYVTCILILIGSIYGMYRLRIRSLNRERKKLERMVQDRTQELQEKNEELEKLSLVASETDNGVIIYDADGNLEWFNEAFTDMTGFTIREYKSERGENLVEVSGHPDIRQLMEKCVKEKRSVSYDSVNRTKDDRKRWMHTTLTPVLNQNGKVNKLVAIDSDITEHKKAEEEIKRKNRELEKLSMAVSKTKNIVLICDAEGELEWVNDSFEQLFNCTLEEFKQERGDNLIDTSGNPHIEEIFEKCREKGKAVTYENMNRVEGGKKRWFQTTLTPVHDPETGDLQNIVIIDSDITDRKRAEEEIKQKNKDITDSINYAQRIQQAIFVPENVIRQSVPESFVLLKPQHIVSGDFYYFDEVNDQVILSAIDCTGHGVPGAFMSLIGNDLLKQIVHDRNVTSPAKVLNELDRQLEQALLQETDLKKELNVNGEDFVRDGMDLAFCVLSPAQHLQNGKDTINLQFAGANNPVYLIRNRTEEPPEGGRKREELNGTLLYEIPPNKQPIGKQAQKKKFTDTKLTLQRGDSFYIFSDGFPDQFGGPEGKKFMYQRFRQLLLNIHDKPMDEQKKILDETIEEWMEENGEEQIDDICILGVRV